MLAYGDIRLQDRIKDACPCRLPLYPFTFNRMGLTASSPLMVVSDFFVFLMNRDLYCRVTIFY
jgi:hypothetical protein